MEDGSMGGPPKMPEFTREQWHKYLVELLEGIRHFIVDFIQDEKLHSFILQKIDLIELEDFADQDEILIEMKNLSKYGILPEDVSETLSIIKSMLMMPAENEVDLTELKDQFVIQLSLLYRKLGLPEHESIIYKISPDGKEYAPVSLPPVPDNFFNPELEKSDPKILEQLNSLLVKYPDPGVLLGVLLKMEPKL